MREISNQKGTEFLQEIADTIPDTDNFVNLKLGFQFISKFEFSYKGIIQQLMWKNLSENLSPNTHLPQPIENQSIEELINNLNAQNQSQPIETTLIQAFIECLKTKHQDAVNSCKDELDGLVDVPTSVSVSMVEEFADHITFADGVESEWEKFLWMYRYQIWSQLKQLQTDKQLAQKYLAVIDEAIAINNKI